MICAKEGGYRGGWAFFFARITAGWHVRLGRNINGYGRSQKIDTKRPARECEGFVMMYAGADVELTYAWNFGRDEASAKSANAPLKLNSDFRTSSDSPTSEEIILICKWKSLPSKSHQLAFTFLDFAELVSILFDRRQQKILEFGFLPWSLLQHHNGSNSSPSTFRNKTSRAEVSL